MIITFPRKDSAFQQPEIFEFDHVHPGSTAGSPTAILYGALGTECFKELHIALSEAATKVQITSLFFSNPFSPGVIFNHFSSFIGS